MTLLQRVARPVERVVTTVLVPLTAATAFMLRRGRHSAWRRAQRRLPA